MVRQLRSRLSRQRRDGHLRRLVPIFASLILFAALPAEAAVDPATIVIDVEAGTVLSSNDSDQPWYPASLTKMMTAYVTFQALRDARLKETSPVRISANALGQAPSKMGFKVGTVMNVDNALKMMLVKSANDIAVAIAETVGGSEAKFVASMNAEARRLGMVSTNYNNPNGLPDGGQVTTARDLAVLARALWMDFPEYRDYFGIPAIQAGKRVLRSQNRLLEQYRGTTGMKTGFICSSGFNMVASASRSGRSVIVVVLGADSSAERNETAARLLDDGFSTWFGTTKPDLATFKATASTGAPADLRSQVCGKRVKQEEDEEATGDKPVRSSLVPRFVLMAPVPVYTGRADPLPGETMKSKPLLASQVPMPRLRPKTAGAMNAYAPDPAAESPTAIQLSPKP
jgi:D-alanyl-D-alanine carboxypeptidase